VHKTYDLEWRVPFGTSLLPERLTLYWAEQHVENKPHRSPRKHSNPLPLAQKVSRVA